MSNYIAKKEHNLAESSAEKGLERLRMDYTYGTMVHSKFMLCSDTLKPLIAMPRWFEPNTTHKTP